MASAVASGSPSPCPSLDAVSSALMSAAPKFGMLIPNRVFVGGIASNTTEPELKQFFTTYGPVKDCKIILDRAGVSKGYGFVTFEQLEDAEKLMKREGEHILFKDRKLNIGPAVRKQQALPRVIDAPAVAAGVGSGGGLLYAAGGVPYTFQNGLAMFNPVPQAPQAAAATAAAFPDGYAVTALPQMAAMAGATGAMPLTYPQLLMTPHQHTAPAAGFLPAQLSPGAVQWAPAAAAAAAAAALPGQQWPLCAPGVGMTLGVTSSGPSGHGYWPGAGTGQLALAGGQYYCPVPAETLVQAPGSAQAADQLVYAATAGHQPASYQTVDLSDSGHHLVPAGQNSETGGLQLLDASSTSALSAGSSAATLQYVDMHQYAAAVAAAVGGTAPTQPTAVVSGEMVTHGQRGGHGGAMGVKRVLAVPRQVICTPPTSYGALYGPSGGVVPPPVKIVAGLGGQRMVTKTVSQSELQIVPKTQN